MKITNTKFCELHNKTRKCLLEKYTCGPKSFMSQAALADNEISVWVAREGRQLLGWSLIEDSYVMIYVHPSHRRQGVGTALVRAMGAHGRSDSLLSAWEDNPEFFESVGLI